MSTTVRGAILMLLASLLPSCTFMAGDSTVRISSTPAGAYIFLDGSDTGKTTPAMLDLAAITNAGGFMDSDRVVTIRKKGFEPHDMWRSEAPASRAFLSSESIVCLALGSCGRL